MSDIPHDPDFFFDELRAVLEFGDSGMRFRRVSGIGIVSILERTIIEILCKKFGLEFNEKGPIIFSEWVEKIKDAYLKRSKLGSGLTETEGRQFMGKANILIVDDDEDIRKMMRLILEGEGYDVDEAQSGKEAIEKSKTKIYDIALLDIVLPDLQGTLLLKKLSGATPKMVKIMVTGYPNLENAVDSLNHCADAYLIKPVNFEKLISIVEEKLEERKVEETLTMERIAAFVEARVRKLLQKMEEKEHR